MPENRPIQIGSLSLDLVNPRLAEGPSTQREALHAVLRAEGRKTLELAKDIAARGLNPSERLIVTPLPNELGRFVVLDGNRRLTALRLLAEPKLSADGILKPATMKRVELWSREYQKLAHTNVDCIVFESRAEANPWIRLRHVGESDGAGLVRWGAIEQMRFDSRENGVSYPELQILDFVTEYGELDDATREKLHDFPITNLQRLVDDAHFRKSLGIDVDAKRRVTTNLPYTEAVKGWTKVVRDLATGVVKVGQIYSAQERKNYLDKFRKTDVPDKTKSTQTGRVLTAAVSGAGRGTGRSSARKSSGRVSPLRRSMAPTRCKLHIGPARLARIYRELQSLRVDDFTNAAAVLFRVFLELTTDHYFAKHRLTLAAGQKESLSAKLSIVAGDLKTRGLMDMDGVKALQHAAREKKVVGANISTFHAYVHNKDFAPLATDLRTYWDNLQPFFEVVWA